MKTPRPLIILGNGDQQRRYAAQGTRIVLEDAAPNDSSLSHSPRPLANPGGRVSTHKENAQ